LAPKGGLLRFRPAIKIAGIPTGKSAPGYAQFLQRLAGGQMGLLDEADNLELLWGGVPHSCSPPSAVKLF
jgi:hypothetical protein